MVADSEALETKRAKYEQEKRNVEEMANMKGKVMWMANKLNERKLTIVMLAIGLWWLWG